MKIDKKKLVSRIIFMIFSILFVVGLIQVKGIASSVEHTHIWASKYDSTNHWEYCTVCNQTRNVIAHSYTTTWNLGSESCNNNNSYRKVCSCGYSTTGYKACVWDGESYLQYTNEKTHFKKCKVCNEGIRKAYYLNTYG